MKTTSISSGTIEQSFIAAHETAHLLHVLQSMAKTTLSIFNRIGTAIALGESGDLDAAHEFRKQNSGKQ